MNLHTDVPTRGQLSALIAARDPSSVSIYLPTNPSSRGEAERIELGNLVAEAAGQLRDAGAARCDVDAVEEEIADVAGDAECWRYQARSLALLATPASLMTFRLPNSLVSLVEVSDRFHLKPLPACGHIPAHGVRARTGAGVGASARGRARPGAVRGRDSGAAS
jgi:hypothetical protein